MAKFGLIGPSYTSQSVNADCQMTMNWLTEIDESGQGNSQIALYPTPGLKLAYNIDVNPIRGMITFNGRSFVACGTNFQELLVNGAITNWGGNLVNDGQTVPMVGGGAPGALQILMVSGGNGYVFDMQANTVTQVSPAMQLGPWANVAFVDGFFGAVLQNSSKFQISNVEDATNWNLLNVSAVSLFSENVISSLADHREVWLWGPKQTVIYFNSGDPLFPFAPIPGGFLEVGSIAQWSAVRLDNSVFWLGGDERGAGIVWRAQGYSPLRVSNHAVETAWQSYATMSDAIAYAYQDSGHSFYVIHFPSANATWVYDVATEQWHQRGFFTNGMFQQHRGRYYTFNFNQHLVGDYQTGNVYTMSSAFLDDFGNPIRRVRRAPHISNEQEWEFHSQLQVFCETGLGPQPPLLSGGAYDSTRIQASAGATTKLSFDAGVSVGATNYTFDVLVQNNSGVAVTVSGTLGAGSTVIQDGQIQQVSLSAVGNGVTHLILSFSTALLGSSMDVIAINPVIYNGMTNLIPAGNRNFTGWNNAVVVTLTQAQPTPGSTPRDPQLMLRWSDDGGHTWSNLYPVDAGQAGQFKKRATWRRLGRSRDRVYEVSASDPIPWRLIDAYLLASPGYQPTERLATQLRKAG